MSHLILNTDRLTLQPFCEDEYVLFHLINTKPYVRRYLWDNQKISESDAQQILKKNAKQFTIQKSGIWKVILNETGEVIGYTGLWYFFDEPQPQLIYVLLEEYTNLGYATEFARAVIRYAFEQLHYKYLVAATDEPHLQSQKLAKRLGMKLMRRKIIDDKPTLFFRIENV